MKINAKEVIEKSKWWRIWNDRDDLTVVYFSLVLVILFGIWVGWIILKYWR